MRRFLNRSVFLASAGALMGATAALAGSGVGGIFNLGQVNTVSAVTKLTGATPTSQLVVQNTSSSKGATAISALQQGVGTAVVASANMTGLRAAAGSTTGANYAVYATSLSKDGYAGYFQNTKTSASSKGAALIALAGAGALANLGDFRLSGAAGEFVGPTGLVAAGTQPYQAGLVGIAPYGGYGVYADGGQNGAALTAIGNASVRGDLSVSGDLTVSGSVSKGSGAFRIDHPLDPQNKYLSHSFVESPDMKNVYDGVVTTDAEGKAVVHLPSYFDALNRDPRYQLTVLESASTAYILKREAGNTFAVKTSQPGVAVSWQVTGIRNDPYAVQHPIVVEEGKAVADRGRYLQPEAYGQPASLRIGAAPGPQAPGQEATAGPRSVELAASP